MSYWTIFILFIKAFFKAIRTTFHGDLITHLDSINPEVQEGIFKDDYFKGLIQSVSFLRVDKDLTEKELRQIQLKQYIPSAAMSYAWLMEFEKYVDKYIDSPMARDSDEVYIPVMMTSYFLHAQPVSALDYLLENGEVCAIVPYLEDMRKGLKRLYTKIDTIEDSIKQDYYRNKLRPLVKETSTFIKDTIAWTLIYDRP